MKIISRHRADDNCNKDEAISDSRSHPVRRAGLEVVFEDDLDPVDTYDDGLEAVTVVEVKSAAEIDNVRCRSLLSAGFNR